ncbi:MAG: hypothetical protein K2K56_02675 [Lachnospiraceae bacterium]|nr:hypothetical protein [Lachnospiraceae bacterium]
MKNREQNIVEQLEKEFPIMPDNFEGMLQHIIEDEVGAAAAEHICQEKTNPKRKRHVGKTAVKWVAVAAIVLVCGVTVTATENSDLFKVLSDILKWDQIEPYMQKVDPEIGETTEFVSKQEEQIFKENGGEELTFENPLWEISDAWYDGATLYFTASQSEEAKQLTDCDVSSHDHIRVNGRDALLRANPMDEFDYDYKLPYHGRYECKVDLTDAQVEGDLEVCIPLVIYRHDAVNPQSMSYAGKQEITFEVKADNTEKAKKAPAGLDNRKSYDFDGGTVEVREFSIAPSTLKIRFKYTLDGPDAEEKMDQIWEFQVKDADGNDGKIMASSRGDAYTTKGGSSNMIVEMEISGIDPDTESITFYMLTSDWDSEGKSIPGTEKEVNSFTLPVKELIEE